MKRDMKKSGIKSELQDGQFAVRCRDAMHRVSTTPNRYALLGVIHFNPSDWFQDSDMCLKVRPVSKKSSFYWD
jgi:hypothetical protein